MHTLDIFSYFHIMYLCVPLNNALILLYNVLWFIFILPSQNLPPRFNYSLPLDFWNSERDTDEQKQVHIINVHFLHKYVFINNVNYT